VAGLELGLCVQGGGWAPFGAPPLTHGGLSVLFHLPLGPSLSAEDTQTVIPLVLLASKTAVTRDLKPFYLLLGTSGIPYLSTSASDPEHQVALWEGGRLCTLWPHQGCLRCQPQNRAPSGQDRVLHNSLPPPPPWGVIAVMPASA
jgi:hypothetical protein